MINAFRVSIDGVELPPVKGIRPSSSRQALVGANNYWLQSSSQLLEIDFFHGLEFAILVTSSISRQTASLEFQFDPGDYLMPIAWANDIVIWIQKGEKRTFKTLQYNLFNSCKYIIEPSSTPIESIVLLFTRKWLEPYAVYCSKLEELLIAKADAQVSALMEKPQFLSLDEISILNRIRAYDQVPSLAGNYYSSLLHVFMVSMVKQVNSLLDVGACDPLDLEKAAKVREIILSDFEIYHTVEALAKMVRMAEMKLQLAFKQLYGTTVINFSRDARLEKGFELLTTTDYPLRVVCMMVGYDDPSNFSCAFKKKYGYWPGYIRKSAKQSG